MCGIAGIIKYKSKLELAELSRFTDSLFHRGPDGSGYKIFDDFNAGIGHRRLSVLDLSSDAHQPMTYENSRLWLSFNGEVYNFIEIREELKTLGFNFRTNSDTEVVLAAYLKWGKDCFTRFNGMWAIALYNESDQSLLLCRDRFGVKPLYYLNNSDYFAFSSETSSFKYLNDFKRSYNTENLVRSLNNHASLEPLGYTLFNQIYQVPPGSFITIKPGNISNPCYYWKIDEHIVKPEGRFEDQVEHFKYLFEDACKLRLRSDVPVGTALSGGLDSSSVFSMLMSLRKKEDMQRIPGDWQRSFSMTFPGNKLDESKFINELLTFHNAKGVLVTTEQNNLLIDEICQVTESSDYISGTPLNCLTGVYKAMHNHGIVVSMDGHGADEYLYGYSSSVQFALMDAIRSNDIEYVKNIEGTLKEMTIYSNAEKQIKFARDYYNLHLNSSGLKSWIKNLKNKLIKTELKYYLPSIANNEFIQFAEADKKEISLLNNLIDTGSLGENQLLREFHFDDLPYNLRDFDRGAMQHQIEIRMPFMDYRLVSYSFSLPQKSKLNNGYTKYVLREAMKGLMPESVRLRKQKIGLGSPLADWLNNELNQFILDLITERSLQSFGFLNRNVILNELQLRTKEKRWDDLSARRIWPIMNLLMLKE